MNTELLKRLAAAGTPIELIAEVAAEMGRLEGECSALDKRRAGERRRKQEQREREAVSRDVTGQDVTGRDVTGQDVTGRDVTDASLDKEKSPKPPKEINLSSDERITTPRARKGSAFRCPDDVDPQHWADFLANRKAKRLTNTETAYRGVLRDLAKHSDDEWPPGRLVQFAAESGWASINDPRTSYRITGHGPRHHPKQNGWLDA